MVAMATTMVAMGMAAARTQKKYEHGGIWPRFRDGHTGVVHSYSSKFSILIRSFHRMVLLRLNNTF